MGQSCLTNTFTSEVELLALHFLKHLQELLEEAYELFCQIILILMVDHVRSRSKDMRGMCTLILGSPREKPVPTGCSTYKIADRFVQLYWLTVGFAVPVDQLNGPFSWRRPSKLEQPGPPLVLM